MPKSKPLLSPFSLSEHVFILGAFNQFSAYILIFEIGFLMVLPISHLLWLIPLDLVTLGLSIFYCNKLLRKRGYIFFRKKVKRPILDQEEDIPLLVMS